MNMLNGRFRHNGIVVTEGHEGHESSSCAVRRCLKGKLAQCVGHSSCDQLSAIDLHCKWIHCLKNYVMIIEHVKILDIELVREARLFLQELTVTLRARSNLLDLCTKHEWRQIGPVERNRKCFITAAGMEKILLVSCEIEVSFLVLHSVSEFFYKIGWSIFVQLCYTRLFHLCLVVLEKSRRAEESHCTL